MSGETRQNRVIRKKGTSGGDADSVGTFPRAGSWILHV